MFYGPKGQRKRFEQLLCRYLHPQTTEELIKTLFYIKTLRPDQLLFLILGPAEITNRIIIIIFFPPSKIEISEIRPRNMNNSWSGLSS